MNGRGCWNLLLLVLFLGLTDQLLQLCKKVVFPELLLFQKLQGIWQPIRMESVLTHFVCVFSAEDYGFSFHVPHLVRGSLCFAIRKAARVRIMPEIGNFHIFSKKMRGKVNLKFWFDCIPILYDCQIALWSGLKRNFIIKNPAKEMSFAGVDDPARAFTRTFVPL